MGNVLKGYRYRIVDNRSFELPLPVKYVLLKEDDEIAEYEVSKNEEVSYRIITKYKENMITPITRPLTISDIYYFFSCRVFQDRTPFTGTELSLLGLERYNVYDIIRKTRGITPYDNYWLRFDGDKCGYLEAKSAWDELMSNTNAAMGAVPSAPPAAEAGMPKSDADINEILNQQKVDVASKITDLASAPAAEPAPAPAPAPTPAPASEPASNTMSADEIEALLMKSGLTSGFDEPEETHAEEPAESASSGGKMSQDDIEKMLAAATGAVEEPAPAPESTPSGGKMSQDDIEKMLAAAGEAVAEAAAVEEPAPVEEPKPSGGKMSQDDIEKMLAAATGAVEEPAPAPEPASSGGKMSQDDIEKMLAAAGEAVAEAAAAEEPAPVEEPKPSGGKMSQDDIEKMLAAAGEAVSEAAAVEEPAPVEEPKPSGGKMSQDDIEKMLAAASEAVQEPLISEPEQPVLEEPEPEAAAPEPEEKPASSGGKMSQADIEALLNGMADDAK